MLLFTAGPRDSFKTVRQSIAQLSVRAFGTAIAVGVLLIPSVVEADLVFFTSGRTMSVKRHRVEGDRIVLELRAGGDIECDRNLVSRIEPDEVPYPEEAPQPESSLGQIATPFAEIIDQVAASEGVDPRLVHAVIQVESGYQPNARSHKGAIGLMQLMPGTARQYTVKNPYDPTSNIRAGVRHLKSLLDRFEPPQALAAYNAGEAAILRFGGIPPYPETRNYVARILQLFPALMQR